MSAELLEEVQEGAKRTNRTLKLQRCELNLQAYSHTGLRLKHVAPIHLTVGSMDLIHPIYVSPLKTYPLLIGKDLLNRFEPLIDFKHLKMWTQVRKPLPCQSLDSNESQCQVTDTAPNSRNDGAVSEPRPEPSSSSKDQDPLLCSLQEPESNAGPLRIMTAIDVHGTIRAPDSGPRHNTDSGPRHDPDSGHRHIPDSGHRHIPDSGPRHDTDSGHRHDPDSGPRHIPDIGPRHDPDSGYCLLFGIYALCKRMESYTGPTGKWSGLPITGLDL
ncbi:hypothetical protein G5714_021777 [Onychostoma macrolepis]|uniref:Uncharacterized protein n=1 Tax=Onychostoma macrolepis TaxID=369639 RepID=A0A7J6BRX2_9TELE|nr:hypothetical protein G5714_021777 [Onychostoma macrolepis]